MSENENTLPRRCDEQLARLPALLVENVIPQRITILRRLNTMQGCFGPLFTAAMRNELLHNFPGIENEVRPAGLRMTSVGTLVDGSGGGGGSGMTNDGSKEGEIGDFVKCHDVCMLFPEGEMLTYPATHPLFRESKYFAGLGLRHGDVPTFDVSQVANIQAEVFLKVVEFIEHHKEQVIFLYNIFVFFLFILLYHF